MPMAPTVRPVRPRRRGAKPAFCGSMAADVSMGKRSPFAPDTGTRHFFGVPMITRRIVVHTDFSEASVTAVHYARLLADGLGATLDFVHVLQEPLQAGWTSEVSTA